MTAQKEWKHWRVAYVALAVSVIGIVILACAIAKADDSGPLTIKEYDPSKWPTMTYMPADMLRVTVDHAQNAVMTVNADATRIEFCRNAKCAVIHIDADRVWYNGELPVDSSALAFFEAMRIVRGGTDGMTWRMDELRMADCANWSIPKESGWVCDKNGLRMVKR